MRSLVPHCRNDYACADHLGAKYGGLDLRDMDRPGEHRTVVTVSLTRVRAVVMRVPRIARSSLNRGPATSSTEWSGP